MRLLLQRDLLISRHLLERIMQAVLFYADSITLRASASVHPNDSLAYRRLNELLEMGLINTWAHEYELPSHVNAAAPGGARLLSPRPPDQVVPAETTRQLMQTIDEELAQDAHLPYEARPSTLREGVSEVVQLRHSLSTLRLADHLGADGLVSGQRDRSPFISAIEMSTSPAMNHESIINEVVGRCSFGPLVDLPLAAIEDCRREMPRFRSFLHRHTSADSALGSTPKPPFEVAALISSEYRRIAQSAHSNKAHAEVGTWDIVGAVLPHSVIVKMVGTRIEWFKYRGRTRPFMLLGKLRHYTQQHG